MICLIGLFYFILKPTESSKGVAIISKNDGENAYVTLEKEKSKDIKINTTIFPENDKVNVEYYKKLGKYYITKIEYKVSDKEGKKDLVKNIYKNENLDKYRQMIQVSLKDAPNSENFYTEEYFNEYVSVIPVEIDKQKYDIIDIRDYINYFVLLHLKMGSLKNTKVTLKLEKDLEILSLESVEVKQFNDIGKLQKIDYKIENNLITFNSLGLNTYYVAKIKLSNGDILNYIFL